LIYDVAVLGLGAMGSACAAQLARRGLRVAGFERFALVHDLGSSAGRTRIIRRAYFENTAYVPILERAYELWRELEESSDTALLDLFGVLIVGNEDAQAVRGIERAAAMYDIPIERFDARRLRERYPRIRPRDGEVGILEPDGGVIFPERAIAAHLRVATAHGAALFEGARARGYARDGSHMRVDLDGGEHVDAEHVVVCTGAWTGELLSRLRLPLRVQRNVQYWFEAVPGTCHPSELPAYFLERQGLPAPVYGMPDLGDGVKIAFHGFGPIANPDALDRDVHEAEIELIRATLANWIPDAAGKLRSAKACMYTMTPDAHFAIGSDPAYPQAVVACGFSGHGYKFAPVVGEIVAEIVIDGKSQLDIEFLRLERLL
jgi:sarcosine oxidase